MDRYLVRRAVPGDRAIIDDLILEADRLAMYAAQQDILRMLRDRTFFLTGMGEQWGCACGLAISPETVAQIRVLALLPGWSTGGTIGALLPVIRQDMRGYGVTTLAYVGLEQWLLDGLTAHGFARMDTIVTMQKTDLVVPDRGNPHVVVRPATPHDFPAILDIDRAAFVPLWHNTAEALAGYLSTSPYFCVAELDGKVVGYQVLSLVGLHGHLTRVAVHPDHQRQRIAARLLAEAIRFFRQERVFGITLNTQRDNHRARRLYEWFGFEALSKEAHVLTLEV